MEYMCVVGARDARVQCGGGVCRGSRSAYLRLQVSACGVRPPPNEHRHAVMVVDAPGFEDVAWSRVSAMRCCWGWQVRIVQMVEAGGVAGTLER